MKHRATFITLSVAMIPILTAGLIIYINSPSHGYIKKPSQDVSIVKGETTTLKVFKTIQKTAINVDEIHRPKKPFKLPSVLSLEDVESLLNSLENIKHKTMLALIYSVGLRRSELLNMTVKDLDSKRMMITIRGGKGNKDRVVPFSATILELLREYYKKHTPKTYLFEGQTGDRYSETSLQEIFHQAKSKAKINKNATLHTLRHSYATHLLEGGTNLRYIQEILGHKSPKTTQIYTHVSNEGIGRVASPIEKMKLNHAK